MSRDVKRSGHAANESPSTVVAGQRVAVLGGGVIGAMCAWHLSEAGCEVTIVDQGRFAGACSHANCGYICPSHLLPLPGPGAIKNALPYLLRRNAPLSIRWRFSPALWSWLWRFRGHCNRADWLAAAEARLGLLHWSADFYADFIERFRVDCEWEKRGLLFVYRDRHEFEEYASTDELLRERFGVGAKPYDADQLVELEPALKPGLGGAWHYEGDSHVRPDRLMSELRRLLTERHVEIIEHTRVADFQSQGARALSMNTADGPIDADAFVVAAGAWTPFLNKCLGCRIPIQPGKGYTITMGHPEQAPKIPMVLEQHRVAITPMHTGYRIGSTMEFAGYDESIREARLQMIRDSAALYLHTPLGEPVTEKWFGWRPMTYDGKPVIDRAPRFENVWMAAGHNMLGLSMAPATGKLVAQCMLGQAPILDPSPFSVSRFGRRGR